MPKLTGQIFIYISVDSLTQVIIDIHDVTFIDSVGAGALVRCKNRALGAGKILQVVGSIGRIAEMLDLVGVAGYLAQPGGWEEPSSG